MVAPSLSVTLTTTNARPGRRVRSSGRHRNPGAWAGCTRSASLEELVEQSPGSVKRDVGPLEHPREERLHRRRQVFREPLAHGAYRGLSQVVPKRDRVRLTAAGQALPCRCRSARTVATRCRDVLHDGLRARLDIGGAKLGGAAHGLDGITEEQHHHQRGDVGYLETESRARGSAPEPRDQPLTQRRLGLAAARDGQDAVSQTRLAGPSRPSTAVREPIAPARRRAPCNPGSERGDLRPGRDRTR